MQLHEMGRNNLFKELSDQEQEVVVGGQQPDGNIIKSIAQSDSTNSQKFVYDVFQYLASQPDVFYKNFDYNGFFNNLQAKYLDSSSPGGANSTVPGSKK